MTTVENGSEFEAQLPSIDQRILSRMTSMGIGGADLEGALEEARAGESAVIPGVAGHFEADDNRPSNRVELDTYFSKTDLGSTWYVAQNITGTLYNYDLIIPAADLHAEDENALARFTNLLATTGMAVSEGTFAELTDRRGDPRDGRRYQQVWQRLEDEHGPLPIFRRTTGPKGDIRNHGGSGWFEDDFVLMPGLEMPEFIDRAPEFENKALQTLRTMSEQSPLYNKAWHKAWSDLDAFKNEHQAGTSADHDHAETYRLGGTSPREVITLTGVKKPVYVRSGSQTFKITVDSEGAHIENMVDRALVDVVVDSLNTGTLTQRELGSLGAYKDSLMPKPRDIEQSSLFVYRNKMASGQNPDRPADFEIIHAGPGKIGIRNLNTKRVIDVVAMAPDSDIPPLRLHLARGNVGTMTLQTLRNNYDQKEAEVKAIAHKYEAAPVSRFALAALELATAILKEEKPFMKKQKVRIEAKLKPTKEDIKAQLEKIQKQSRPKIKI
jgi:hypothetical protein